MRTNNWRSTIGVGVALVVVLVVVGCHSKSNSTDRPAATTPTKTKSKAPEPKLFADWPQDPAGVLVISGEQIGYLEPCGCTEGQKGGLIRRYAMIELLKKQGWPVAAIDLGSLLNNPNLHGGMDQTRIKFDIALKALAAMNYGAVALSADDLKISVQEALMRINNQPSETLKFVAANAKPIEGLDFEKKIRPSVRITAGKTRFGVTSVLDPSLYDELKDDSKDMLTLQPAADALPEVLADLEKDTDVQVLMVQGPPESAKRLAQAYPGFDIVVGTSQFVDPPNKPEVLNDGKTWLVTVGKKGQWLGVVGIYPDQPTKMLYQRVMLGPRYDEFKNLAEPIRKLVDDDFVNDLKNANVLASYPRRPYRESDAPADATYVGAETCKECHPNTFKKWSETKHALAYEGLTKPERNREADADCVRCHTTGFEYDGGFQSAELTPYLKGNQCENCHGPGSKHAAEPDNKTFMASMKRSSATAQNDLCVRCHDEDNSKDFKFETYWPRVVHKQLDVYTSPRVHRGITPKVANRKQP